MIKTFKIFTVSLILLLLNSCGNEINKEYSEILHEEARVVQLVYTPSLHLSGSSIDLRGRLQFTSISAPEKFAVVFSCQHGQFIINQKQVYYKLQTQLNQIVDVSYKEIYRTEYDRKTKALVSRDLVDYDFIDANPIANQPVEQK